VIFDGSGVDAQCRREKGEPGYYVIHVGVDRAAAGPFELWATAVNWKYNHGGAGPGEFADRVEVRLLERPVEAPTLKPSN
jgi:hypothetical protein